MKILKRRSLKCIVSKQMAEKRQFSPKKNPK